MNTTTMSVTKRFWGKVNKDKKCWVWTAACDDAGYGVIRINGITQRVHRLSWEIHFGKIPTGMWVLHRCDNRPCVRPDHLFLGTALTNVADMVAKGRQQRLGAHGEANGMAKFCDADIVKIRALCANGADRWKLAIQFGVRRGTIDCIAGRRSWRHIP